MCARRRFAVRPLTWCVPARVSTRPSWMKKRRRNLIQGGAVSEQELTNAETELRDARAAFEQAEARLRVAKAAQVAAEGARQANDALISDTTVDTHPEVLAAAARFQQACVDLARLVIKAPVTGVVTQRSVDVGQHVQAGMRLMRRRADRFDLRRCQLQGRAAARRPTGAAREDHIGSVRKRRRIRRPRCEVLLAGPGLLSRPFPPRTRRETGSRSCNACRCA